MEAIIAPIPSQDVGRHWPTFKPFIERVLRERGGKRTADDIVRALIRGDATLWAIAEKKVVAAVVTEIFEADERICRITCLAGDGMERWIQGIKMIETWAKDHGCAAVTLSGRRGWRRVLKDYELSQVTLRKEL